MDELLIRIEDVLNGKYRFVEGQPVKRSYVDMEIENMTRLATIVETARGYLAEAISDLDVIDVSHMSMLEKSSLYCAKMNIKDALNLLEK